MKAGASVYLTKPFSPNVLGHEVRKLFAGDDGLTVSAG
jgi:DNA-binding response OmpR family regulator